MTTIPDKMTIGIEEEYLLVDKSSFALIEDRPVDLIEKCNDALDGRVTPEFLRCQIEVGTNVCANIHQAEDELKTLRKTIAEKSALYNMAPVAASTHPFSSWRDQKHTDSERYNELADNFQALVRRLLICGMHVHVGIPDDDIRIDIMNQVKYFMPHMLALSTSSPFWEGDKTGLMSYRLAVWDEVPRTGLPSHFQSYSEYVRYVQLLIKTGIIEDGTKIWWDIRPSAKFPTIEMRIADSCTSIDDTLCLAALFTCLVRMLLRHRRNNLRWRQYSNFVINENRWRAQRYGIDNGLIDFGKSIVVDYPVLIDEILEMIEEDMEALDCKTHVLRLKDILKRGTSAHKQLKVYEDALNSGAIEEEALKKVTEFLIEETVNF